MSLTMAKLREVRRTSRPASPDRSADLLGRLALAHVPEACVAAVASLALAFVGLRLWRADLSLPLFPTGDSLIHLMLVRNMQESGWFQSTGHLGAPYGQHLAGFPGFAGDTWQLVILRALSFGLSPAATLNLYYLASFPLTAGLAVLVMRRLEVGRLPSVVLGTLYALLPYHYLRGEAHPFLASYFLVPVGCLLVIRMLRGEGTFTRATPARRRWSTYAVCALLAGFGVYYAAFTLTALGAAALLRCETERSLAPLRTALKMAGAYLVVLVGSAIPNIAFQITHPGQSASVRNYAGVEVYGLKLITMLLPSHQHVLAPLAHLSNRLSESPVPGEGTDTLGMIGATGLVIMVAVVLRTSTSAARGPLATIRQLGVISLVLFLFSTVGGFGAALPLAGFDFLRALNRASVFLAFLALTTVALLGTSLVRWLRKTATLRWTVLPLASLILIGGFADQFVPRPGPDYQPLQSQWRSDELYFHALQVTLGPNAPVFQLPYVPFPESPPVVRMTDYQHLRGYLHSDLDWSYGGLKNGDDLWQPRLIAKGPGALVDGIARAGFVALFVDRDGYADPDRLIADLDAVLGPGVAKAVDGSGQLVTYDLRPYRAAHGYTGGLTRKMIRTL